MKNKDKGDGIEDSPLDMLQVILLEGVSKEVLTPSSGYDKNLNHSSNGEGLMHHFAVVIFIFIF